MNIRKIDNAIAITMNYFNKNNIQDVDVTSIMLYEEKFSIEAVHKQDKIKVEVSKNVQN